MVTAGSKRFQVMMMGIALGAASLSSCTQESKPAKPNDVSTSPESTSPARSRQGMSAKRFQWKPDIDETTKQLIDRGGRRLMIEVTAFEPPSSGPPIFVVQIITAKGVTKEIGRFGLHPNAPFEATGDVEPQRFQFSLQEASRWLDSEECQFEVFVEPSEQGKDDGSVELNIQWIDLH